MSAFPPKIEAFNTDERPPAGQTIDEPDVPSLSGGHAFMWGLVGQHWKLQLWATITVLLGSLPGALIPLFTRHAVDDGILAHDYGVVVGWCAAMLGVLILGNLTQQIGYALTEATWLGPQFQVINLVNRKVNQMGHVMTRRVPAGELLSVASSDSDQFGNFTSTMSRLFACLLNFAFVAVMVMQQSVKLGLLVLISAPVLVLCGVPLMKPLQRAQATERERSSILTGQATDIVAGLRILRGIGGERTFGDNYAAQSQRVRSAGVRAQTWFAAIDSVQVLLSGLLLIGLTWIGANELLAGHLTAGQLVAFFGWAMYLSILMSTFYEAALKFTQTLPSARKTIAALSQRPPWLRPADPQPLAVGDLVDETSGVVVAPGQLTILVSQNPDETAAIVDRLGRYLPSDVQAAQLTAGDGLSRKEASKSNQGKLERRNKIASQDEDLAEGTWGASVAGVDLADVELTEVRDHLLVAEAGGAVFAGTLQDLVDPKQRASREQAERALWAASAEDVWEAIPGGWQGRVEERGRGFSGGQRQRLVLARALLADPEVLLMVEPTSAVDAHTEARIAERLPQFRNGETTILTTVSPLWLRHADHVIFIAGGQVAATGTHEQLLAANPQYRAVVKRGDQ